MDPSLFARATGLGFTIAAAVGPISLLTMRRTIEHGRLYGLVSGLGVALADGTYAAIAAFGLSAATALLVGGQTLLGLVGGIVIIWLGARTFRSMPHGTARDARAERPGLVPAFASIYALTMTNPATILSFAALFAGLGLTGGDAAAAATATAGIFVGSSLWWVILTSVVAAFRSRVTPARLVWLNRASGAVLLAFGVAAVGASVQSLR
jgi:threonine/homoserine/homoserine lactone efflux protein